MSTETTATTEGDTTTGTETETATTAPAETTAATSETTTETAPAQGTDWKAESRKWEKQAKANKTAAEKLAQIEADKMSEIDKANARADAAEAALAEVRTGSVLADAIKNAGGNSIAALAIKGADALADVDMSDTDAVTKAVTEFINEHPELKTAPTVTASRVDHTAGTGEGVVTKEQFDAMSYDERVALRERDPETYDRYAG